MSLDPKYQKRSFLNATRELIVALYAIKDSESPEYKTKGSEFDGFMKAGITLGIVTRSELKKIIDEEHWSKFGMTIKERKAKKKDHKSEPEINNETDWSIYDTPTIKRK